MSPLDWGSVPAWLGAGSLLIAFQVFRRDRTNGDRAQVDRVGVWFEVDRDPSLPGSPRNNEVKIRTMIRNGSDLPVEVTQIKWDIDTRWLQPDRNVEPLVPSDNPWYPGVHSVVEGDRDAMKSMGPVSVAPQATVSGNWQAFDLGHTAPVEDARLYWFSDGVKPVLRRVLVTDNAGRRWETRHEAGRPARRMRWYSRRGENYPAHWQRRRFS